MSKLFPCGGCGATLTFSPGAQALVCGHCGHRQELELPEGVAIVERDLEQALATQAERRGQAGQLAGTQEVRCGSCGATVQFSGSLTSTRCAYCDSPLQRAEVHQATHRLPVDGLCTFRIEKEQASERLKAWVKSRWFAPNEFLRRGVTGNFEGVYLPYFTFDAATFTRYRGERGDAYTVTVGTGDDERQERRVRWSPASGQFQEFFDDVCIPAVKALPHGLLHRLEPWPLDALRPFTPGALAGALAHTYELPLGECFRAAKANIDGAIAREVDRRIGGDEQRVDSIETQYSALTYKHVLLPVWLLAYRYADKPFRVAVNAMTGEVSGERPWSVVKIVLAIIAVALAVGLYAALAGQHGS